MPRPEHNFATGPFTGPYLWTLNYRAIQKLRRRQIMIFRLRRLAVVTVGGSALAGVMSFMASLAPGW